MNGLKVRSFISILSGIISTVTYSQSVDWAWPLDSPRVLTANYGELRPNHFHAGLDFSTGGQINQPVYCAAAGYVSRIKVSSTGYGKCVYITHPNGKVTVYGHLNAYSLKINTVAKKEQELRQSFEMDMKLPPNIVAVRRGEIIGLSGSTGSSTGPHLHFEIRDEISEAPLNPLEYYKFPDYSPPIIQSIGLYSLSDTLMPRFFKHIRVNQNEDEVLLTESMLMTIDQSMIGISFSGLDRFTPSGSANNIYSVKLFFDGRLVYHHKLSGIKFDDTRYINEYSETHSGIKYQKCFLPQNYPRDFVFRSVNRGRIFLKDTNYHMIKLLVTDESGSQNDVQFFLRCNKLSEYKVNQLKGEVVANAAKNFSYKKDGVFISIPAGSLYYSTPLIIENTIETTGKLMILPGDANLRNPVQVCFKSPVHGQKNKMVLKNASLVYTPVVKKDSLLFMVKTLGAFQLITDTKGPKIIPAFKTKGKKASVGNRVAFTITDAISGIGNYKLFFNGKWVMAEYDAKSDLLFYDFDEESPGGDIQLKLEVEDRVGNKSRFECNFRHRGRGL